MNMKSDAPKKEIDNRKRRELLQEREDVKRYLHSVSPKCSRYATLQKELKVIETKLGL